MEKSSTSQPLGSIKQYGDRKYVKTDKGWRYHGRSSQKTKKKNKEFSREKLQAFAKATSTKDLESYLKKEDIPEINKKVALEELNKRNKTSNTK